MMTRLFAVAALLLAGSAAQAQYQFEYNGQTIRIDPDRGTVSIPGVYDNTGERAKRPRRAQETPRKQPPREARSDSHQQLPSQAAPAGAAGHVVTPSVPSDAPPAGATTTAAPVEPAKAAPSSTAPAPQLLQENASPAVPLPSARPAPAQAATAPVLPTSPAANAAPVPRDPNSPVGIWLTEEKEGKIRIEPCGTNLCGYAIDARSNENREEILINMRPGQNKVWSGRIFDPDSGSTYDSTIAMKGPDSLRVQGCALGGMFCGGQTWTRVN